MNSTTITTTFIHKDGTGPKILAKGAGKQRTTTYDHALSIDKNHGGAAGTLADVLGWKDSDDITHDVLDTGQHRFVRVG